MIITILLIENKFILVNLWFLPAVFMATVFLAEALYSGVNIRGNLWDLVTAAALFFVGLWQKNALYPGAGPKNRAPQQYVSGADEIKKYKELLDNGAITPQEYEEKKKQILGL